MSPSDQVEAARRLLIKALAARRSDATDIRRAHERWLRAKERQAQMPLYAFGVAA